MITRTLYGPFTQVLPMTGLALKGPIKDNELKVVKNAGILIKDDFIIEVGEWEDMKRKYFYEDINLEEIDGPAVCLPGYVDSHTHICFGGSRAMDFAMRNAGKSYLEIAEEGGGIWSTVNDTREASDSVLLKSMILRVQKHLKRGITSIEVKSGYGLSVEEELRILRVIKKADKLVPAQIIPTCLAAHIPPKGVSADVYLKEIAEHVFPILQDEGLAKRVDAFIEKGAFGEPEILDYLKYATLLFDLTIHGDQFSVGGSKLAVDINAVSVDHLEVSGEREIEYIAKSNTVATALPGASIGLGCSFAPARKLLDAGACLAIASDWNPGSAPQGNLIAQASIIATNEKLTTAEVLAAITYRGAHALRLSNVGQLKHNSKANFNIYRISDYREILYHQGELHPSSVVVNGQLLIN